ncbi:Olfactory receptor 8D1 [Plecturocebus cupreus]
MMWFSKEVAPVLVTSGTFSRTSSRRPKPPSVPSFRKFKVYTHSNILLRHLQKHLFLPQRMTMGNSSTTAKFVLAGLTRRAELHLPLLHLFLGIRVVTVVGNLGMILLIVVSPLLHTPMYYFLSSLSFIDFCYSSVITPKMLVNFLGKKNTILHSSAWSSSFSLWSLWWLRVTS